MTHWDNISFTMCNMLLLFLYLVLGLILLYLACRFFLANETRLGGSTERPLPENISTVTKFKNSTAIKKYAIYISMQHRPHYMLLIDVSNIVSFLLANYVWPLK